MEALLTSIGASALTLLALRFVLGEWISTRIRESVAAEYKKQLEDYREQLQWESKRREQAARVAELLSLWVKHLYEGAPTSNARLHEVQAAYWQLALWLDADVLRSLNGLLSGSHSQTKETLVAVRKAIIGRSDTIISNELVHFEPK